MSEITKERMNHCYTNLSPDVVIDYASGASGASGGSATKLISFVNNVSSLKGKKLNVVVFTMMESEGLQELMNNKELLSGLNIKML